MTASQQTTTGKLIPAYWSATPLTLWQQIVAEATNNPTETQYIIINPDNGPGTSQQASWADVKQLLSSVPNIIVMGYVHTSYGNRAVSTVMKDVNNYMAWYGITNIFIDEMSSSSDQLTYYQQLASDILAAGGSLTIGNPGTEVDTLLMTVFSSLCLWEDTGLPSYPIPAGHGYIALSVKSAPSSVPGVGSVKFVWITDDDGSYDVLASYYGQVLTSLADAQPPYVTPPPTPPPNPPPVNPPSPTPTTATLTIVGQDASGDAEDGYWTTCTGNGQALTGYTTATFTGLTVGVPYTIAVSGYEDEQFAYWQDDQSTSASRTVTLTGDLTLTAIFSSTQTAPPPNPPPPPPPPTQTTGTITVNARVGGRGGSALRGYFMSLQQNGAQVQSGFTSASFTVAPGQYALVPDSAYGGYAFEKWANGSSTAPRVVNVTAGRTQTITAVYKKQST